MMANDGLSPVEIEEVRNKAGELRGSLSLGEKAPIANDLYLVLERLGIIPVEYPVESDGVMGFDAYLAQMKFNGTLLTFLGLNSAQPFDKQLFDVAHELYHFMTNTIDEAADPADEKLEKKADRFAAEILLPCKVLYSAIMEEFSSESLREVPMPALLRFIARIHFQWWLP